MMALLMVLVQGVDELRATGSFQKAEDPKAGACWTSARDLDGSAMRDNWVEREFRVEAGKRVRAWAFLGGCCRETLQAYYQVSEGTVDANGKTHPIDPGSNMAAPLKFDGGKLPLTHPSHGGEKRPASWLWVEIPLPAFSTSGAKTLRVLSDQKGFSVARVHVGTTPPEK